MPMIWRIRSFSLAWLIKILAKTVPLASITEQTAEFVNPKSGGTYPLLGKFRLSQLHIPFIGDMKGIAFSFSDQCGAAFFHAPYVTFE
ncbi:hypothetical protein SAMN04487895_11894 [Paenibacillus sophorae]|uniref:Uncharacterized protein n=1 Tax=Paenibacillus sophorae TaxID=1333845 RepID=A0A1H8UQJ1_9BACL|nr:hypothetical protein SAMN04487895_11894 [Paenibacillus sophorae]